MIKILFVCHGNICRSPMAEFVMKDMVRKAGRKGAFEIASAATSSEEIRNGVGNPVYPPAKRILAEHGIRCDGKRARRMTREDYAYYDIIVCMDRANVRNATRIAGGDPDRKITMLLEYTPRAGEEVADPWYTDDFEATWIDVEEGCAGLLKDCIKRQKRTENA